MTQTQSTGKLFSPASYPRGLPRQPFYWMDGGIRSLIACATLPNFTLGASHGCYFPFLDNGSACLHLVQSMYLETKVPEG